MPEPVRLGGRWGGSSRTLGRRFLLRGRVLSCIVQRFVLRSVLVLGRCWGSGSGARPGALGRWWRRRRLGLSGRRGGGRLLRLGKIGELLEELAFEELALEELVVSRW